MKKENIAPNLRSLTKSSVWDLQESEIISLLAKPEKDDAINDRLKHYLDVMRSAFEIEEVKVENPDILKKYEARGMRIAVVTTKDCEQKFAIKKRVINRVTDLTYENIRHVSAAKLLEVINSNFGGGWDSLNQGIKDIIQSAFDVTTTTLPTFRLKKPGGLYDVKVNDGYDVLEIDKGGWTEAIFAKLRPVAAKPKIDYDMESEDSSDDLDSEKVNVEDDDYYRSDEEDQEMDEDMMMEESYRTTIEEDPDGLSIDATDISDGDDEY